MLNGVEGTDYILGDIESITVLMDGQELSDIDLSQTVGILLVACFTSCHQMASFVPSWRICVPALPQAVHGCQDQDRMDEQTLDKARAVLDVYKGKTGRMIRLRSYAEIESLFEGWQILQPPGLQFAPDWVSSKGNESAHDLPHAILESPEQSMMLAAVAELPS